MNILNLLDEKINGYFQKNNDYPAEIIMDKGTKDKIFEELNLIALDNSWKEKNDNYKGIKIVIKKGIFLELK
jgi:spore coat polysaccharide biosynthesis protein SpsF (cytidylyltransferase family)